METILADVLNHEWNLARDAGRLVAGRHESSWPHSTPSGATSSAPSTSVGRRRSAARTKTRSPSSASFTSAACRSTPSATGRPRCSRTPRQRFEWLDLLRRRRRLGPRAAWSSRTRPSSATCSSATGCEAADVFFIDDHEPNVLAARALGMYAHHFRDAAEPARRPRGQRPAGARSRRLGRQGRFDDRRATTPAIDPSCGLRVPSLRSIRSSAVAQSRQRLLVDRVLVGVRPERSRMSAMSP